ncbi:hypothetical protein GCM10027440_24260 [Nocardiopsis coralliicola]
MRSLNHSIVIGSLSAVGALLIAVDARSLSDGLLLGSGLALTLLVVQRWKGERVPPGELLAGLAAVAVVWLLSVLVADLTAGAYFFAVLATVTLLELPRHRRVLSAVLGVYVAAVLVVKLTVGREDAVDVLIRYVGISACVSLGGVTLAFLAHAVLGLVSELARAREREAEMAVMQERVRFAGDLHDIQGHTLHVVKLKIALAKRLLQVDAGRAERELDEVHTLVGDTIAETKELAYAQRRLNLSAELENAKNLLEAAGISVHVDRSGEPGAGGELLGQVLRETTTNILRHSDAGEVRISLTGDGISVANDGAGTGEQPRLGGLAALRDRLAAEGGTLEVERSGGRFRTAAAVPYRRSGAAPTTRKDDR